MPKKQSKNRKKIDGDITIQQFADSALPNVRIKKTFNSNINNLINDEYSIETENYINNESDVIKKKNINKNNSIVNDIEYNDYHIDIWFLISEHIKPEDTGKFALICKKTDAVVSSARYWLNLYRRYYSSKFLLPDKLKPHQMNVIHGLRARVISSLFYIYPPFVTRLSKQPRNLSNLENLNLVQSWYKRLTNTWMFCYRFKLPIKIRKPEPNYNISDNDDDDDIFENLTKHFNSFLIKYNNLFDNKYEGQHLLIVFTDRFIPLPKLHNHTDIVLKLIKQPLTINNFSTGLEMYFSNYRNVIVEKFKYDTIINYRILNWWDPEFSLFEILN